MQKLNINLEYCYGIKKFQDEFDFSGKPVIAIYASNGMMKTSFAKTFRDVSNDESPKDIIYEDQPTICEIRDENNKEIDRKSIFVVDPYVELNIQDKIKPILVNRRLQEKYTDIHKKN